jgi:hypothetical protein
MKRLLLILLLALTSLSAEARHYDPHTGGGGYFFDNLGRYYTVTDDTDVYDHLGRYIGYLHNNFWLLERHGYVIGFFPNQGPTLLIWDPTLLP